MDILADALKFLEVKSVSEEGNEEAINYLVPFFERIGAKLVMQQVPHSLRDQSKRQFNLLAILGDDLVDSRTKKGLLLTAPVDTAGAGSAADWIKLGGNPFAPKQEGEFLYGLGAANSKLNFLAMAHAAAQFSRMKFQYPLYLAATCGGESSLAGCRYLIQSGAVNPKQVIVGRPTSLCLQNTEKSQMVFHVRISFVAVERDAQDFNAKIFVSSKSRATHVADPNAAKNSVSNVLFFLESLNASQIENKLLSIQGAASLNRVPDLASAGLVVRSKDLDAIRDRFRSIAANHRDCHFEMRLGGTGERGIRLLPEEIRVALGRIRAEIATLNEGMAGIKDANFLPDHSLALLSSISQERDFIDLKIHLHLLPELASAESRKEIEKDFKARMANIAKDYRAISLDCRREFGTGRFHMDPTNTFVSTVRSHMSRVGIDPGLKNGNFASEAAHFQEKGYDVLVFGAGDAPSGINCPDEKVKVEDLKAAVRFYGQAIEAFCFRGA